MSHKNYCLEISTERREDIRFTSFNGVNILLVLINYTGNKLRGVLLKLGIQMNNGYCSAGECLGTAQVAQVAQVSWVSQG
jgi:hypothetical protein